MIKLLGRLLTMLALAGLAVSSPAFAGADKPLVLEGAKIKQLPSATALQLQAPTAGSASINLPHGTSPSSPTNGDCWTTTSGLFCRISGVTVGPYASTAGGGGGGAWALVGSYDFGTQPATATVDFTGLSSYNELLAIFSGVGASASTAGRLVRLSTDNGATFYSTSGDYKEIVSQAGTTVDRGSAGFVTPTSSSQLYFTVQIRNTKGPLKLSLPAGAPTIIFTASASDVNAIRFSTGTADTMNSGKLYLLAR